MILVSPRVAIFARRRSASPAFAKAPVWMKKPAEWASSSSVFEGAGGGSAVADVGGISAVCVAGGGAVVSAVVAGVVGSAGLAGSGWAAGGLGALACWLIAAGGFA